MELSEHFSFYVEGYRFQPAYKNGVWDGKIRLISTRDRKTLCGLLPEIAKLCKERDYQMVFEGGRKDDRKFTMEEIKSFLDGLKLSSGGNDITPHDYQVDGVYQVANRKKLVLLSPTSSGKSLMIYASCRLFEPLKTLVVVPSIGLVTQMYNDFVDYAAKSNWNVEEHVSKLFGGKKKENLKQIVISTWQSIMRESPEFFEQFEMVVVDECHGAEAKSLKRIMESCTNAHIRVGTTGTMTGTKTNKYTLIGLFGMPYKTISTKELMDAGRVANLKIKCIVLEHDRESVKEFKSVIARDGKKRKKGKKNITYQDEIAYICESKVRMDFIEKLVRSLNGNTLVLFTRIEHGEQILARFKDRDTVFIDGEVSAEDREAIRQYMETHNDVVAVMSYGTSSTGMSIKNIQNIVFASPYKSTVKVLQSIGRSLRKLGDKTATVFDIADKIPLCTNNTMTHFDVRVGIYSEEKFNFEVFSKKLHHHRIA